jgi:hypothetical protein
VKKGGFTPRKSDLRTLRWVDRWQKKHGAGVPDAFALFLLLLVLIEVLLAGTKEYSFRHGP